MLPGEGLPDCRSSFHKLTHRHAVDFASGASAAAWSDSVYPFLDLLEYEKRRSMTATENFALKGSELDDLWMDQPL